MHPIYRTVVPLLSTECFSQQYIEWFFLDFLALSPFIPVQNVVYFTMLPFFRSIKYHILHKWCAEI